MDGLSLAERYFHAYGLPMIRDHFPLHADRMACGLVGDGSECFGFDDEISRDHDWGPGFCIWLSPGDHSDIACDLKQRYDRLCGTFAGFGPRKQSRWGEDRVGVFEIGAFYYRYIGCSSVPGNDEEWMRIPEWALAAATNGRVFHDPLGEFSLIRKRLLHFYPDDVRLKKIAARCMSIAQSGQYNLPRCLRRGDLFAARYAEIKFCADVISLIFLLNRRYTPFFKWMNRGLERLPRLGSEIRERIDSLMQKPENGLRMEMVEEICSLIIKEFREEGLTDSSSTFLLDHGPIIHARIRNRVLRQGNVWIG